MKIIDTVKLEFDSRSVNESFARVVAASFIARLDPTIEELNDVKTAVSEAVTNCIVHAYPDTLGKIHMILKIRDDGSVSVTVRDRGLGIDDINLAKTPMFTTGGSERSGMGFSVMESFMDTLRVRSAPGRGTTVVMVKKFSSRELKK